MHVSRALFPAPLFSKLKILDLKSQLLEKEDALVLKHREGEEMKARQTELITQEVSLVLLPHY